MARSAALGRRDWTGKIFIATGRGMLTVYPTSEKLTVPAKAKLPIERCNSPAIVDGKVFVRPNNAVCRDAQGPRRCSYIPSTGSKKTYV